MRRLTALVMTVGMLVAGAGCSASGSDGSAGPASPAGATSPASASMPSTSPPAASSTSAAPTLSPNGTATSAPSQATSTAPASRPVATTATTPVKPTSPPAGVGPYAGKIVAALPGTAKVVALTFDGGADARGAQRIVDTLRANGVSASFFVTGRFAEANPGLIRQFSAIGPVGNHSWDHPHFPQLTDAQVQSQVSRTRAAIAQAGGGEARPFFRFPFGESSKQSLALVNADGYLAVGWTVDSLGWQGTSGGQTAAKVADRVVAAQRPGEIVLMHLGGHPTDNSTLDADALPSVITRLRAAGYSFVTLSALR